MISSRDKARDKALYIFIGRFQPLHIGHMHTIKHALSSHDCSSLLVLCGISLPEQRILATSREAHHTDRADAQLRLFNYFDQYDANNTISYSNVIDLLGSKNSFSYCFRKNLIYLSIREVLSACKITFIASNKHHENKFQSIDIETTKRLDRDICDETMKNDLSDGHPMCMIAPLYDEDNDDLWLENVRLTANMALKQGNLPSTAQIYLIGSPKDASSYYLHRFPEYQLKMMPLLHHSTSAAESDCVVHSTIIRNEMKREIVLAIEKYEEKYKNDRDISVEIKKALKSYILKTELLTFATKNLFIQEIDNLNIYI